MKKTLAIICASIVVMTFFTACSFINIEPTTTENTTKITTTECETEKKTTKYSSTTKYHSTTKSSSSRECYVCGEKGASKKVGSYWYCSTHAAYVNAASGGSSYTTTKDYDMPNESDDSFADYVQRVDPDLYQEMEDILNSLE